MGFLKKVLGSRTVAGTAKALTWRSKPHSAVPSQLLPPGLRIKCARPNDSRRGEACGFCSAGLTRQAAASADLLAWVSSHSPGQRATAAHGTEKEVTRAADRASTRKRLEREALMAPHML